MSKMDNYHARTAYDRRAMTGHSLDWSLQPHPYKRYRDIEPQVLVQPRLPQARFFDLALGWPPRAMDQPDMDAAALSAILLLSAGLTAQNRGGAGLRAWASAGALFPSELYLAAQEIEGLEDGLYHFSPSAPGLHPLWLGKHAAMIGRAQGRPASRLTFFLSAMYWRSLWKYRSRAYRYCLLDTGHLLANLELACAAAGQIPLPNEGFVDGTVNMLLGLATNDEAALCLVRTGEEPDDPGPEQTGLPPLGLEALPLSRQVGRDHEILAAHSEGECQEPPPSVRWQTAAPPAGSLQLPPAASGGPPLLEVIGARRSRRNFLPAALDEPTISRLLAAALPAPGPLGVSLVVPPVKPLEHGVYRYHPGMHVLEPRPVADQPALRLAQASLNQMWVGQAAVILVLWANLELLQEINGPRVYRRVMLDAGRAGQRLYLAATAQGLGCCGVGAFYDDEVAGALRLPAGAQPLYLLACGPVKGWPQ